MLRSEKERRKHLKESQTKYERKPRRIAQHNSYLRKHYDRIQLLLPKGMKKQLKSMGISNMNGYLKSLIYEDMKKRL